MAGIDEERPVSLEMPSDFKDKEEFLAHARKLYNDDTGADSTNRTEQLEDHNFVAGKQWDDEVYQRRINNKKPALTINRLPAFVAQVVGNRRLNETGINVIPNRDADKIRAGVRKEIIRSIQNQSRAKRAYDIAFQNQVIGGMGNFEVLLDFTDDDVFEQDIHIEPIHNPLSVVWDRLSYDPTGLDAAHVFVTDRIDLDAYKKRWPNASTANFSSDSILSGELQTDGWLDKDTVRIASFWRMRSEPRTIAMMTDGEVNDVTDKRLDEYIEDVMKRPDGSPVMREVQKKFAEKYLISGADVLEGPYILPINRLPVFRAPGWEINIGDTRTRFGLVRFLRDPQRLHNYWRSTIAEKLMMSPKAKWLAAKSAVKGQEKNFRESHLSEDNLLVWIDSETKNKPELVPPIQMEQALIAEASIASQDIKDISNLHEASLGQKSNEVSGKAISARQSIGQVGTVIYQDNLNMAIEESGNVINQLIPHVYDTPRVLKITGDTPEELKFIKVNYDGDEDSIDLSIGKYHITSTTGPSFETKRVEARESMMAAVNAMPDVFAVVADLIATAQDWPDSDKMAERIRSTMPPNVLGDDLSDEQKAQVQAQQEAAQQQAQLETAERTAKIAELNARRALLEQQAMKTDAETAKIEASIDRDDVKTEADISSQETRDALQAIDALTGENNVSG